MTTSPAAPARVLPRQMLNKVPEVTVWFWIIKILCTTVGESFADYVNETLGFGLLPTAMLFTVVFVVVLAAQMRLRAYVPAVYWLTVVVVSVTGTLYTDILTDRLGVPLWISSTVFAALLAAVFGAWYLRERTLSIHSIVTTPREAWYWLAVLVTFALGTATGDWTLQLTGWAPGKSVLLPLTLIAVIAAVWRYGANPVLAFWLAYILTRPLGANIGDWLASPSDEQGLGLGTLGTSLVFLGAILAAVVYLSMSRADVIVEGAATAAERSRTPVRERVSLAVLAAAAVATFGLLSWANAQPHSDALAAEEGAAPSCSDGGSPDIAAFPAGDVASFRSISQDTRDLVASGDQSGAASRATDLETAWDDAESRLVAKDCVTWTYVDHEIDAVLTAVRSSSPDQQQESGALDDLLGTLG
ncbi:hypothetical protein CFH99_22195 [Nocardioides aromaticivorans]|uniref:Membrane-anchored protein n=1 Tax=Nocardioides aromaticivorans TaxID=200618 RepID=A0ABX7PQQ9_9ACTN|nr:hypothetical protein [Nocardioides aromaticivorans]QSR28338.1 hypothetical protein CFH99_22195 [Nocardioides aromaticivorans]